MFVRGVRAAIALGVIAASAALVLAFELMPAPDAYFSDNALEFSPRTLLLAVTLGAFAIVAGGAFAVGWRSPDHAPVGTEWLARALCPAVTLPFLLPLLRRGYANDVETAILLAFFVLGFERSVRVSLNAFAERPDAFARAKRVANAFFGRPKLVLATMVALAAFHAFFMSQWAVWSHQRFNTFGYDLGQYDQIFTSVLKGQPLRIPALGWDEVWGELNGHADFGTFYMIPIYFLYPRAATLLVMQGTMLAAAAIPLYLFARRRLPEQWAFVLGISWLLYAPLHGAQFYDVHMQPFGAAWAMFAIAAVDAKRWKLYWLFFTLAILVREDVSIGLTMFGVFMFLSGYRVRTGLATIGIAASYFLVVRFGIMGNQMFADTFKGLYPVGEAGFGAVLKTMISNPGFTVKTLITAEKIRYMCQIFAPMAFLPMRRAIHWFLFVPGFLLTVISTEHMPTIQISFQYVSNWATWGFAATALMLAHWREQGPAGKRLAAAGAMAVLVASVIANLQWGAYSPHWVVRGGFNDVPRQRPTEKDYQREKDLQELMKMVPEEDKICASEKTLPHVTWHLQTWSLRDALWECKWLVYSDVPGEQGSDRGANAIASGEWEVAAQKPGLVLGKKKPKPAPVPPPPAP